MRDLVVREALAAMAVESAELLRDLIAVGEEIPYEVREPGDGSPLCRYEPLTERFVRDHASRLRELDSFGAACAALEATAIAGPYLHGMGITVPDTPRSRAELAGVVFLCRLWMDSSDFSLDQTRLDAAIEELELGGDAEEGQIEVIVPLRGVQMPVARLDVGSASIVRADTVEIPAEARSNEGLGVSPWEPAFLAVVRVESAATEDGGPDAGLLAVLALRRLVTTLRLFKAGGVGLGPHAWTRLAGDRWRRIATGSGRHRPGGYRLTEAELGDLAAFSRALGASGTPFTRLAAERPGFPTTLGRAINRFEAGLERNVVVEALNDHLLALRFLLEGGGPADLGLSMRVAALCAEPEGRDETKAVVDRAIGLERELWSGEPAPRSVATTPAETAAELEDLARAILKDAAVGHLGSDLRSTADEILLADGLAVGEGSAEQRGGTTEWDLETESEEPVESLAGTEPPPYDDLATPDDRDRPVDWPTPPFDPEPPPISDEPFAREQSIVARESLPAEQRIAAHQPAAEPRAEQPQPFAEEVSALDARISSEPSHEPEEETVIERAREIFDAHRGTEREPVDSPVLRLIEQTRAEREAHHERVAGLFPAPETTEWNVREISYDRSRRARVS